MNSVAFPCLDRRKLIEVSFVLRIVKLARDDPKAMAKVPHLDPGKAKSSDHARSYQKQGGRANTTFTLVGF